MTCLLGGLKEKRNNLYWSLFLRSSQQQNAGMDGWMDGRTDGRMDTRADVSVVLDILHTGLDTSYELGAILRFVTMYM